MCFSYGFRFLRVLNMGEYDLIRFLWPHTHTKSIMLTTLRPNLPFHWKLNGLDKSGKQIKVTWLPRQARVQVSDKIQLIMNMLDKAERCCVDIFSAACAPNKWHTSSFSNQCRSACKCMWLFFSIPSPCCAIPTIPDSNTFWRLHTPDDAVVGGQHDDYRRRHSIHLFEDQGYWARGNSPSNCTNTQHTHTHTICSGTRSDGVALG